MTFRVDRRQFLMGSTALLAGTCSAPTPSVVDQPVVAQVNSNLQNNVWSFSDYLRAAASWIPSWGSSNAQTVLKEDLLRSRPGAGGDLSCANADPTVTVLIAGLLLGLRSTSYTQNAPVAVRIDSNASIDSGLDIYGEASIYDELNVTRVVAANAAARAAGIRRDQLVSAALALAPDVTLRERDLAAEEAALAEAATLVLASRSSSTWLRAEPPFPRSAPRRFVAISVCCRIAPRTSSSRSSRAASK